MSVCLHLSAVQGLCCGVVVVEETHVDEVNEEARRVFGVVRVVRRPFVEDEQHQVTEQRGHEHDLRDEAQEDVQRLLEIPDDGEQQAVYQRKYEGMYLYHGQCEFYFQLLCIRFVPELSSRNTTLNMQQFNPQRLINTNFMAMLSPALSTFIN